ncbi:MAG TPA: DUF5679 domain-containing protein [Nitrososphaera sp.]|nr:DUF5679 domain-containing protein [Nitrososphaera sp.]
MSQEWPVFSSWLKIFLFGDRILSNFAPISCPNDRKSAILELFLYPSVRDVATLATQAYCVKCKAKREMKGEKQVTMENGRNALSGTCSVCGTKMFKIGGGSSAGGKAKAKAPAKKAAAKKKAGKKKK